MVLKTEGARLHTGGDKAQSLLMDIDSERNGHCWCNFSHMMGCEQILHPKKDRNPEGNDWGRVSHWQLLRIRDLESWFNAFPHLPQRPAALRLQLHQNQLVGLLKQALLSSTLRVSNSAHLGRGRQFTFPAGFLVMQMLLLRDTEQP